MNNNELVTQNNEVKPTNTVGQMTAFLTGNAVKKKVNDICGKKEGDKLISNLISNVQQNPALAECEQGSIVSAALAGHALKLDFALQQAYIVPFKSSKKGITQATFMIGWRGYIQLAMRSGQYLRITTKALKEGELKYFDDITEEYKIETIEDDDTREKTPTTHYLAYFKLINGFEKVMIWSRKKMELHARKYSQTYKNDIKWGTNSSYWSKDFDSQGMKTMIRQLISKFGVMSTEMQDAYSKDMAVLDENGNPDYVDNQADEVEVVEVTVNGEQVKLLCDTIIAKTDMTVPQFFEEHEIENVNKLTIDEFNDLMKELGATNE